VKVKALLPTTFAKPKRLTTLINHFLDMQDLLLLATAILPGLLIAYWIYRQDRYEPEPPRMLIRAFAAGCVSTLPALVLQYFLQDVENEKSLIDTAIFAFLVVGFTEEISKFLLLRLSVYPSDEFNEPMDGIVYAVVIGMGFATLENVMYVLNTEAGGFATAIGRAFTAIPAHAAFGVLMGAYVGLAKFVPERRDAYMLIGVTLAVFFHGLYDFFLLQKVYEGVAILAIAALVWGIHISRRLIKMGQDVSPFKHGKRVAETPVLPADYEVVTISSEAVQEVKPIDFEEKPVDSDQNAPKRADDTEGGEKRAQDWI
jgi:protease PrsW